MTPSHHLQVILFLLFFLSHPRGAADCSSTPPKLFLIKGFSVWHQHRQSFQLHFSCPSRKQLFIGKSDLRRCSVMGLVFALQVFKAPVKIKTAQHTFHSRAEPRARGGSISGEVKCLKQKLCSHLVEQRREIVIYQDETGIWIKLSGTVNNFC